MSTHHILSRSHATTDNLTRAELLKAAAVDQMYTFDIGTRTVIVREVSDHLTVTGRFMSHSWGCSIQLWARNKHGKVQAAAESSVVIDDQRGGNIASRTKQFRTGELLWTHTADPVSQHSITPELDTYIASRDEAVYQLKKDLEVDNRDALQTIWVLTSPGQDFTPIRFGGLTDAVTHITANLPGANK
jgi:hypothetical protein